jgi:acetolactate synthase I/II/III large subunit
MAVDVLPSSHPLRVGMIGSYGNRWANLAIGRSDFLLVLGSRLDIRQTGSDTEAFKNGREIYHVDCEAGEINNRVLGCHPIISDLHTFLETAIELSLSSDMPVRTKWLTEIKALRETWQDVAELRDISSINPNELIHQLSAVSSSASTFVVDVGQHQMWAAQSLDLGVNQQFITSGGMGAMGFALPAAIGVALGLPERPVVVIAGDGGFQLNIQELQTIKHHQLPIKIIVINNQCYGMVRQFQQSYFDERYPSTLWGYSAPDFVRVAEAYGIAAFTVNKPEQVSSGLETMWQEPNKPFLLEIMVDTFANAYPKIAFGKPITEMEPFAKPVDMEGT